MTEDRKYTPLVVTQATEITAQIAARLCRNTPIDYTDAVAVTGLVVTDVLDSLIEDADFYGDSAVPMSRLRRLRLEFASRLSTGAASGRED